MKRRAVWVFASRQVQVLRLNGETLASIHPASEDEYWVTVLGQTIGDPLPIMDAKLRARRKLRDIKRLLEDL